MKVYVTKNFGKNKVGQELDLKDGMAKLLVLRGLAGYNNKMIDKGQYLNRELVTKKPAVEVKKEEVVKPKRTRRTKAELEKAKNVKEKAKTK